MKIEVHDSDLKAIKEAVTEYDAAYAAYTDGLFSFEGWTDRKTRYFEAAIKVALHVSLAFEDAKKEQKHGN